MGQDTIQKLRQKQSLVRLPDGREGVLVTLQFRGDMPSLDRASRKRWLGDQFNAASHRIGSTRLFLKTDTVSPSAQTIEAICPVDEIGTVTNLAQASGLRLDVVSNLQVVR